MGAARLALLQHQLIYFHGLPVLCGCKILRTSTHKYSPSFCWLPCIALNTSTPSSFYLAS